MSSQSYAVTVSTGYPFIHVGRIRELDVPVDAWDAYAGELPGTPAGYRHHDDCQPGTFCYDSGLDDYVADHPSYSPPVTSGDDGVRRPQPQTRTPARQVDPARLQTGLQRLS